MRKLAMQTQRMIGSLLLAGLFAACVAAPPATLETPPALAGGTEAPATAPTITTSMDYMDYTVTELSFTEAGATFFALIDQAAGAATQRLFVEVIDDAGILWQGEQITSPEKVELFLQQAQQREAVAMRIDGPADGSFDAELSAVADLLPVVAPAPLTSPHPEIRFVRARERGDAWSFDVTLAYPDTGWEDYADGWHIATSAGQILGTRVLLHPHENEQPFTRSLSGVRIPPDVDEIVIRSHDLLSGYSPDVRVIPLRESTSTADYEVVKE